jgi:23S rRNA pseudouridine2605 synthase
MTTRRDDRPEAASYPRLQKVLASAGYGSRRQCEALIVEGRVEVDGQPANQLGTRVDPARQRIRVDGVEIKSPRRKYFMLHKPVGVVSTARDPWARTRVIDLVEDPDRLFTIGRLDKSSSGLILVTNDGDLAQRLTHPSYGVQKVYRVVVAGKPTMQSLQQLRRGIHLAEGRARVDQVTLKRAHAKQSVLEIVLSEGRNREIRRLLARVGHKVQQLKRVAIGPVKLGDLPVGAYRELEPHELAQLRRAAATTHRPGTRPPTGRTAGRPAKRAARHRPAKR